MWVRSNIPAFQHSLADISRWGWGMWALELVAVSAALTSIGELVHVLTDFSVLPMTPRC